jgi:formylglycine-generating enzyme required for sulfatase activity
MQKLISFFAGLALSAAVQAGGKPELPREVVIDGVEFVLIPEGWFHYPVQNRDPKTGFAKGSGMREVKAWVDSFYIGKYEARARDFVRFMNSGSARYAAQYGVQPEREGGFDGDTQGCSVRREGTAAPYYQVAPQEDLPATHLSWDLANEFAGWMGFRLPTDAEWVRAFRGDDKRIYPWGDEFPDDTFAGFQEGGTACDVRSVTAYPKGRSPYGVYNMAGNIYEYVADWFNILHMGKLPDGVRNPLATEPHLNQADVYQPLRLLRGGRWASGPAQLSIYGSMDTQPTDRGFRCFGARFAVDAEKVRDLLAKDAASVIR